MAANAPKTMLGPFIRAVLLDADYFGTRLPRIPVPIMRDIEEKVRPCQRKDRAVERESGHRAERDGDRSRESHRSHDQRYDDRVEDRRRSGDARDARESQVSERGRYESRRYYPADGDRDRRSDRYSVDRSTRDRRSRSPSRSRY
jgi:pre-mRNA-splicing factor 38B